MSKPKQVSFQNVVSGGLKWVITPAKDWKDSKGAFHWTFYTQDGRRIAEWAATREDAQAEIQALQHVEAAGERAE